MSKNLLLSAFFAVLTAVGGVLSIPLPIPIPITLQGFFVFTSGVFLGAKYGALSQVIYIVMGLIGLPVFAGGSGGPQTALSPSFGFLLGFVAASWTAGFLSSGSRAPRTRAAARYTLACLAAMAAMYAVALPCFYFNMNYITKMPVGIAGVLKNAFLPFVAVDSIKAAAAGLLASRAIPVLSGAGLLPGSQNSPKVPEK